MWTTGVFVAELAGTLFLTMMALFVVLASVSDKLKLSIGAKKIFSALLIGLSLALAIYVTLAIENFWKGTKATGYINPAIVLLFALSDNNYDLILPSLAGELAGGIIGAIIVLALFKIKFGNNKTAMNDLKMAYAMPTKKTSALSTIVGELFGSFVFLGTIAAAVLVKSPIAPILIGLGITLVLLTFGLRSALILNVAAGIIPMIIGLKITKPENKNASFLNVSLGGITNLAVGVIIGAIYYGISQAI